MLCSGTVGVYNLLQLRVIQGLFDMAVGCFVLSTTAIEHNQYSSVVYGVLVPLVQSKSGQKEEWKAPKSKRWYSGQA